MNNIEKEYIYLSNLVFDDKFEAIQEIKESNGLVKVEKEDGSLVYYGNDGSIFGINLEHLNMTLENKGIFSENKYSNINEYINKSNIFINNYIEKLRKDIELVIITI